MRKAKFSCKFIDNNDGAKIKMDVTVEKSDLSKDLGQSFIFIETSQLEPNQVINQEISIPFKSVSKLIKALRKVSK